MGRNGESGAFGLAAARGGVAAAGVGARFARFGTGIGIGAGTSNVASEPLRDRMEDCNRLPHAQAESCHRYLYE